MSMPISACLITAATKNETAFEQLLSAMRYNISCAGMTIYGCKCNPPCQVPPKETVEAMWKRMNDILAPERQAWEAQWAENLKNSKPISTQTLCEKFGISYDSEVERLRFEAAMKQFKS